MAHLMTLATGTKLGPYEVQSPLGAGGMGEVYRAHDFRLHRDVAIKVMPRFESSDPGRLRRFEQEATAAAALNHPNVLAIYELGTHEGAPYLVSELLEGETLREQLRRGPLPQRKAVEYGVQISQGLAAAHERGIVHRDLKPENLFVTKEGRVKILDFGLAKLVWPESNAERNLSTLTLQTEPGLILGTVGYMSPEQVQGKTVDHRADIFALGTILYELLAGHRAFQKPTSIETMSAILKEEPPGLSDLMPSLPPALHRVVHRCLQKNPAQRFQSASDLAFALDAISDITQARNSGIQSTPAVIRPQEARLRWTILLAIGAIGTIALLAYRMNSAPEPPRIVNYSQITDDHRRKQPTGVEMTGMVNDGTRVFFTEGTGDDGLTPTLAQVSSEGGETVPIPVPFQASVILDISPSMSELLVATYSANPENDYALWAVPVLGGSPRRLGNARSLFAAWSPDGKKLVYSQGPDLYLATYEGADPHKIVTVPGIPGWVEAYIPDWVRWSPDSRRIRFSLQDPKSLSFSLWEVSADGTNLHPLLPGWNNPPAECCGVWTRDGRYFVFQSTRNGRTDLWALREPAGLLDRGKHTPVQLTAGPMSFLGPDAVRDGKHLFALGVQSKDELVRYDSQSRQFLPYLPGLSAEGVAFSRDGRSIAYVAVPQGTLWRSKLDGSVRVQLSFPPLQVAAPQWSPDGKQIAFMGRAPGKLWQIYIVPADGGNPQQVVSDQNNEGEPNWSPNGDLLVFSQLPEVATGNANGGVIRVQNLKTHRILTLPQSQGLYSARWSPDGQFIAATTGDKVSLFAFAVQKWTTLSHVGGSLLGWSRDSYIYFEHGGAIFRIGLRRREPEEVLTLKGIQRGTGILGFKPWAGLAPDNSVLLLREASNQEIYSLQWQAP